MGLFGNGNHGVPVVTTFDVVNNSMITKGKGHYVLPGPDLLNTWYGVKHTVQTSFVLHFEIGSEKVICFLSKTENHADLPNAGRCAFGYLVFPDEKRNTLILWADDFQKLINPPVPTSSIMTLQNPQVIRPLMGKVTFPGNDKLGQEIAQDKAPLADVYLTQYRSFMSEIVCNLLQTGKTGPLSPREVMLNKLKALSSDRTYSRNDLEAAGLKAQTVNIAIENLKFPVLEEIERGTFVFYSHTLQRYLQAAEERKQEEQAYRDKSVTMKGTDGSLYRLGANEDGVIDGSVAEKIKEGDE